MKKFLKITGILTLIIILGLYLSFIFVLPKVVDLNEYKPQLSQIAKEQGGLTLNLENPKLLTTALLGIGIQAENISVKFQDDTELLSAEKIKTRISLPSLLLLTVKVSCLEIDNPKINIDIVNNQNYKIIRHIQNIVNEQKLLQAQKHSSEVKKDTQTFFNPEWIKIKVSNIKINNYKISLNDLETKHYLSLQGKNLLASYNVNKFKIKTFAEIYSDTNKNITANIDINSFIPKAVKEDPEDDPAASFEPAFTNPVTVYRNYDLKTNILANLKIREKRNGIKVNGIVSVDNFSMDFSGYKLPESSLELIFKGSKILTNANIFLAENQNIKLLGQYKQGLFSLLDLKIKTSEIKIADFIKLIKASLDSVGIKNDLEYIHSKGVLNADAEIKTNFKSIKSKGYIVLRDTNIDNSKAKLSISDINSYLSFDDNMLTIKDTHALINNKKLAINGQITENANVDLKVFAEELPLSPLFKIFAPSELKKQISIDDGKLYIDSKITGEIKNILSETILKISNFSLTEKSSATKILNEKLNIILTTTGEIYNCVVKNNKLKIYLPTTNSTIELPKTEVIIDTENIFVEPSILKLNKTSVIDFTGTISNYLKEPFFNFKAFGNFIANDIKQFLGKDCEIFIKSKGILPFKLNLSGDEKKQTLIAQMFCDEDNYLTPIDIDALKKQQTIFQTKLYLKGNKINIKDTGIYTNDIPVDFADDFEANIIDAEKYITINGTIVDLNTTPFINQIKITLPREIKGQICAFKDSLFTLKGNLLIYGQTIAPKMSGHLTLENIEIPDLYLTLDKAKLLFDKRKINFDIKDLIVNENDIKLSGDINLNKQPLILIEKLKYTSEKIDLDKFLKVAEASTKFTVQKPQETTFTASEANLPIEIINGKIDIKKFKTGDIIVENITSNLNLQNNKIYINNLIANLFEGLISGDIGYGIFSGETAVKARGSNFNVEKALKILANIQDTMSGKMNFVADIKLKGTTQLEQMKSLEGKVDFTIKDGQVGPFAKLENLILAENIRESEFFQTALGGVIDSITKIDTSHFSKMDGKILFKDGITKIKSIATEGNVLCLSIFGDFDLIKNTADIKVRGRLASLLTNMLGPIASVNPVNLIQNTPGLNIVLAKTFFMFCETVTEEEMNAIPDFEKGLKDINATKFQVVLNGDVAKPLSLVKSFKWLATFEQMKQAENFTASLPTPETTDDGKILTTVEEINTYNAKFSTKVKKKMKNIFDEE